VNLVGSVRSLSSRWVALTFATSYLVVSAIVGIALLTMPNGDSVQPPTIPPNYLSDNSAGGQSPSPPESGESTRTAPTGFQFVSGPANVQTVIPIGWQTVTAGGPGAMRASDPSDASRVVGYGGARAKSTDLVETRVAEESSVSERTASYERIDLNKASYGGHLAVEWEFTYDDGRGTQHVRALYWLVNEVEYFIFAAGAEPIWETRMKPVYDAMVANSRP
jgi:hypothetical protein